VKDFQNESERLVHVEWDTGKKMIYPTRISIVTQDKPGLLANISSILAECDVNIIRANVQQGANKRAYFDLSIEIHDLEQLNHTLEKVQKVDGVIFLERVKEYKKKYPGGNKQGTLETDADLSQEEEILVN
jgi:GTP pyrophosphokinase